MSLQCCISTFTKVNGLNTSSTTGNCVSHIQPALIASTLLSHSALREQACQAWVNWGVIIRERQPSCRCSWGPWILELATACTVCTWGKDAESLLALIKSERQMLWVLSFFVIYTYKSSCLWNFNRAAENLHSCALNPLCFWAVWDFTSLDGYHTRMNSTFSVIKIMHRAVQEAEEKDERSHRERDCH